MKEQYEKLELEIYYLNEEDVLTISQEAGAGDGWVKDPFIED